MKHDQFIRNVRAGRRAPQARTLSAGRGRLSPGSGRRATPRALLAPAGRVSASERATRPGGRGDSKRALTIDPGQSVFHNSLGEAFYSQGQWSRAKDCFQRAIALDPDAIGAHYNLGQLHQQEGNPDAAVASLSEVLRLDSNLAEVRNEIANLLRSQGNHQQALSHFRQVIASKPELAEAHNDLGNLLQDMGRLDEAIGSFEEAVRLQPTMAAAHYNLGNALRAAALPGRAAESYRQAVRMQPDFAQAYNNLGTTLEDLGDRPARCKHFRRRCGAIRCWPKRSSTWPAPCNDRASSPPRERVSCAIDLDPLHAPAISTWVRSASG